MTHEAYKAFDGNEDTFWQSSNIAGNHTLGYQFDTAQTIMRYAIQANVSESDFSYPTDWTFEGSNNGSSWYTLDTQTSQSFTTKEKKYYNIITPISYLYYRLNISNYVSLCICGSETIGYTSAQMVINGQQTLTVIDASEDCIYYWEITSGGGSLSSNTGASIVYTTPSTNPNCENNPTISLSCDGSVYDTLDISVNAYTSSDVAYTVRRNWQDPSYTPPYCRVLIYNDRYFCDGTLKEAYLIKQCINWCCGGDQCCGYGDAPCNEITCAPAGTMVDVRTSTMLSNGCCPEELL
jgi:hypothetical protein